MRIPLHKLGRNTASGVMLVPLPQHINDEEIIKPHRDDHHLLIFCFEGKCNLMLDFEKAELVAPSILHINAGQVHQIETIENCKGWILAIQGFLLEGEFSDFLQNFTKVMALRGKSEHVRMYENIFSVA